MPKYSVIVPVYNASSTIRQCLSALAEQTIGADNYEVIVVDDGSTDGTAEIIKGFPFRYIHQTNDGPASARNRGAREARGDIILFTDADCVPTTSWVHEMAMPFVADPEVAAVKGAYMTSQGSLTARFAQIEFEERFEMLKVADSIDMVDTYSAAFRKDVFLEAGGFDESFPVANNEDTELSYKLSAAGKKMVFSPKAVVYHLRHPDTPRKYARQKFWRGYWRMVVYKRFPGKMMKDTYTPESLKWQTLTMLLMAGFFALAPFSRVFLIPALVAYGVFMATTITFSAFALERDIAVGLLAPFFLALRGLSVGLGVVYYFIKRTFRKRSQGLQGAGSTE